MSQRNRKDQAKPHEDSGLAKIKTAHPATSDMTTECLAATVERELHSVEAQLARLAASESRPYESFDLAPSSLDGDKSSALFEYDGQCPPQRSVSVRTNGSGQLSVAQESLHEAKALIAEIRRLHAAAREILGEIEQLRAAAGRACAETTARK